MTRAGFLKFSAALAAATVLTAGLARADNPKMIIYVSPNPLGVNEFLKMGKTGTNEVAKALGAKARTYEAKDPTTRKQDVEAAVHDGADIVVVLGFEFNDIIPEAAKKNPNTKFLIVDQFIDKPPPNVWESVFREWEGAYLAGAEAALVSKNGKVGSVAALDIPFLHRWTDAFADGAKAARPDITVLPTLIVGGDNAFSDPVRAEQQAQAMIAGGADVIFGVAAGGNGGVFKAAKDRGVLAIGVDANQCPSQPGAVLDNMVKHVDKALKNAVEGMVKGGQPQIVAYGLKEGGVGLTAFDPGLAKSQCEIAKHPDVIAKVKVIADKIESGEIKLSDPMLNPKK
ncbi:MAG TPA: BMP family ABC transporter substrate-binding protein [Magnetospirillaceae bacterium]|jgi:basic membrane protein A